MIINHSLIALQANNQLAKQNKNTNEKIKNLSSGKKFDGARGAAAEYAISEKMKTQIRSLEQNARNLAQGRTVTGAAMGGLDNVYDLLATIKEKTINCANSTNSDQDRKIMQEEVDQLIDQINDIAVGTEAGGTYPLLRGGDFQTAEGYETKLGQVKFDNNSYAIYGAGNSANYLCSVGHFNSTGIRISNGTGFSLQASFNNFPGTVTQDPVNMTISYRYQDPANDIDFEVFQSLEEIEMNNGEEKGVYYNVKYTFTNRGTAPLKYDIALAADPVDGVMSKPDVAGVGVLPHNNIRYGKADIAGGVGGTMVCNPLSFPGATYNATAILSGDQIEHMPDYVSYASDAMLDFDVLTGRLPMPPTASQNYHYAVSWVNKDVAANASYTVNTLFGLTFPADKEKIAADSRSMWIQSQTKSNQGFFVPLCNATAKNLGIEGLNISTLESARGSLSSANTVGVVDLALNRVNDFITRFGAYDKRMEVETEIRTVESENLTSADSVNVDANMAKEMTEFTKYSILSQAAQAMMSQANHSMGNVLSLLK